MRVNAYKLIHTSEVYLDIWEDKDVLITSDLKAIKVACKPPKRGSSHFILLGTVPITKKTIKTLNEMYPN